MADFNTKYKKINNTKIFTLEDKKLYFKIRVPAIVEALRTIFKEIVFEDIKTFIDFGAGPGTGFLAASEYFPLKVAHLIEHDPEIASLALKDPRIKWQIAPMEKAIIPSADLGLFSYSLGETINPLECVDKAFSKCKALVIVEPGTPRGFALIREVRKYLIGKGATIVAPCPHAGACPIVDPDWCHFAARVIRSKQHRIEKGGTRNYEDEKFSYLVVTKKGKEQRGGRILSRPEMGKGHLRLKLCTENGLVYKTYTRSQKAIYKEVKKSKWGQLLSEEIVKEGKDKSSNKSVSKSPNPADDTTKK